jgi:U3 small nucleolar RNA-associated protein 14
MASDSSYDSDAVASHINSESDESNYDGDDVISLDDDEDIEPTFCYDVDHPCVDEGVIYPDVNAVKSALTHHSITTDYAFQAMNKYKGRFRAKVDIGLSFQQ